MKKILYSLGTLAAVATPISAVVACGRHDTVQPTTTDAPLTGDQLTAIQTEAAALGNALKGVSGLFSSTSGTITTEKVVKGKDTTTITYHSSVARKRAAAQPAAVLVVVINNTTGAIISVAKDGTAVSSAILTAAKTAAASAAKDLVDKVVEVTKPAEPANPPTNGGGTTAAKYSFNGTDYATEAEAKAELKKILAPVKVFTIAGSSTEYATSDAALDAAFAKLTRGSDSFSDGDLGGRTDGQPFDVSGLTAASTTAVYVWNNVIYQTSAAAKQAWLTANPTKTAAVGVGDGKTYVARTGLAESATVGNAVANAVAGANTAAVGLGDGKTYIARTGFAESATAGDAVTNAVAGVNTAAVGLGDGKTYIARTGFAESATAGDAVTNAVAGVNSAAINYTDGEAAASLLALLTDASATFDLSGTTGAPATDTDLLAGTYVDAAAATVAEVTTVINGLTGLTSAKLAALATDLGVSGTMTGSDEEKTAAVGVGDGKTYVARTGLAESATTGDAVTNAVAGVNTAAVGLGDGKTYVARTGLAESATTGDAVTNAVAGVNTAAVQNTTADAPEPTTEQADSSKISTITFGTTAWAASFKLQGTTTMFYIAADKTKAFKTEAELKTYWKAQNASAASEVNSVSKVKLTAAVSGLLTASAGTVYDNEAAAFTALIKQHTRRK